jgi:putative ABC transport system permease protein
MRIMELVFIAMRTVVANPLRTMLTMLGVIIGVGSVVTLVALGNGTSDQIAKQYENLGTNLLVATVTGIGRGTSLDYNELMQFEQFPEFKTVAPTVFKPNTDFKYDRTTATYSLIGTNDRYMDITKTKVANGRFISQADLEFRNNVVVLGSELAKKFFGLLDPVGEDIKIEGINFTIIGVLEPKGSNISGTSVDSAAIVPLESARREFKLGFIQTTYFEAPTKEDIYLAQDTMTKYLTSKFKNPAAFILTNQDELLNAKTAATDTLTNQLVAVACISLLVGGIGIMNIMLVTVSERTREIGIRKSIGAKRRNILFQFLVEATVISGMGGLIGLLFGIGFSIAWPHIYPSQPTKISMDISIYAFLFSALVGVIFGLYPANKASKLRPIDALRFD